MTAAAVVGLMLAGSAAAYAAPTGRLAIASVSAPDRVAVSGARIAYADMTEAAGWDVFVRDGVAGRTVRIGGVGDQSSVDLDGTLVVFTDFSRGDSNIRGYDLLERRAFDICAESGDQSRPRISGDWVVWSQLGLGSTGSIAALNLRTSEQVVVADSLAASPDIAGTTVVYEDHSTGTPAIVAFDLAEKTAKRFGGGTEAVTPATDGTTVAWATPGVDGYDIAFQRIDAASATVIARAGEQMAPAVSDSAVSFTERVAGEALRVASVDIVTQKTSLVAEKTDIVGFDVAAGARVLLANADGDSLSVSASVPSVSLLERVRVATQSVWRKVAPVARLAWAPEAPTFSAGGVEQAAALRRPTIVSATLSGPATATASAGGTASTTASVTVTWQSPRSLRGVKDYDVYRSPRPIDARTITLAKRIATGVTETRYVDVVKPSATAPLKASAYYYAVIARDHEGTLSQLSASISADPHGAGRYTIAGVDSCGVCHSVHASSDATQGALGARSADRCYDCHGSTAATDSRGAGSFFDTQARFRDDATNTAGPRLATGASIHRNATMVQRGRECTSCHDAHARPYAVDATGAYDKAASSSKLLRTQVASGAGKTVAWTDADPAGVRVCLTCHGSTMTPIALVGGTAAYGRSGGDHAGEGKRTYDRSAHASVAATGSVAAVQCLVCHNQHGSATARLVDYRQSNTADANANKQANLCYRCHNSVTTSTWNGRDVATEFTRASRHPSVTTTSTASGSATCVSCHNTHFAQIGEGVWDASRVSDPLDITGGVSDTTTFCLRCHSKERTDGSITIAAVAETSKLVPYEVRMRPSGLWAYFTGWGKADSGTEFVKSGHATASARNGRAGCETCHDPHASDFSALTAWTRPAGAQIEGGLTGERANSVVFSDRSKEENLCYQCHGNGAGGSGKALGAADVLTPAQGPYAHPVSSSDAHDNTESAADLASRRHAECVDCHDPHAARAGLHRHDSSTAGESVRGAVGVKPVYAGGNWGDVTSVSSKRIVPGTGDDYEAYLCLKCHSAPTRLTGGGSAGFATNVAREFNPRNFSYHRVLGAAQSGVRDEFSITAAGSGSKVDVAWRFPTSGVFASGYDRDTMMTCTSCHGSSRPGQAAGPHGSSSRYLLDPEYPVDWNSTGAHLTRTASGMPEGLVCSKCHSLTDGEGGWGNNVHAEHAARGGSAANCRNCHVGVPHGWKRPRLLGYTTDETPYGTWKSSGGTVSAGDWGLTRVKVKSTTSPQGWVASDCYAGCHSVHTTPVRAYWP